MKKRVPSGGDVLHRAEALRDVGSYDPKVMAAEDDELLIRLRLAGWSVQRLAWIVVTTMRICIVSSAWWKRTMRHGHSYGQVGAMHDQGPYPHFRCGKTKSLDMGWCITGCSTHNGLYLPWV